MAGVVVKTLDTGVCEELAYFGVVHVDASPTAWWSGSRTSNDSSLGPASRKSGRLVARTAIATICSI
jgi:hypothetical protein